jgi:hypothetical protein
VNEEDDKGNVCTCEDKVRLNRQSRVTIGHTHAVQTSCKWRHRSASHGSDKPVVAYEPAVYGCSFGPGCQIGYRTLTRATRSAKTVGSPAPVLYASRKYSEYNQYIRLIPTLTEVRTIHPTTSPAHTRTSTQGGVQFTPIYIKRVCMCSFQAAWVCARLRLSPDLMPGWNDVSMLSVNLLAGLKAAEELNEDDEQSLDRACGQTKKTMSRTNSVIVCRDLPHHRCHC